MGITGVVIWFTGATAHLLSSPVPPSRGHVLTGANATPTIIYVSPKRALYKDYCYAWDRISFHVLLGEVRGTIGERKWVL